MIKVRHELRAAGEELDRYTTAGSPSDPTEMLFAALVRLGSAVQALADALEGDAE